MSEPEIASGAADRDLTYTYRPSLLGAPWQFRLAGDVLFWDIGRRSGCAAVRDIRRVRMSYRPVTMQNYRFVTEVWLQDGMRLDIASSSWKSMVEQERLDKPYAGFIGELHRRIVDSGTASLFETGIHRLRYWLGFAVFVAVMLGLAALVVRSLQAAAWVSAALIGAFFLVFLWHGGNYLRRNRPGRYRPDALPDVLVP
jgi:hypothetical protein